MWLLQRAKGDPRSTEFSRAQEYTRQMRECRELRSLRLKDPNRPYAFSALRYWDGAQVRMEV